MPVDNSIKICSADCLWLSSLLRMLILFNILLITLSENSNKVFQAIKCAFMKFNTYE